MDNEFGGTLPLEIILTCNYDNVDKDIDLIDSLSSRISKENLIGNTNSVVDILKFIDSSGPIEDDNIFIPFSFREKIFPSSIWKTISKSKIGKNFVSVKDSIIYFRINCRVKSVGSDELKSLLVRIESYYSNDLKDRILTAGIVPFFVESNSYLISSQINSFTIAFIFILFFFLIFTKSVKLGLIALIPNIFPIIFTIGLLGIFNIPLDLSNIMIASIAIGIIVDDTIHFLYNYSKDKTLTAIDNIRLVYKSISIPILSTSIIVSAGFFILGFSDFAPTKYFGILAGILVIIALISDLLLFPALLKLFENTKLIKREIH
jgi:predicted RND superfamily exporter protein